MGNRLFTWANNQNDLVMTTIDRVFCTIDLDRLFSLANIQALPRLGSDHTPIFWGSGLGSMPKKSSYKLEKWWLLKEDFTDVVVKAWNTKVPAKNSVDTWQKKKRNLRKATKGWSANFEADLRRLKKKMMMEYDTLDIKAETIELSSEELTRHQEIRDEMSRIWLREETKARQRSRDKDIKEGDRNTTYFHVVANQRRRKTLVHTLEGLDGPMSDHNGMLDLTANL